MTNKEILLEEIGETKEELIPELSRTKKRKPLRWALTCGACAAAVLVGVMLLPSGNTSIYGALPHTAEREIAAGTQPLRSEIVPGSMGFEGMMAYDISELDNANPWNAEMEIDALPVYRNLCCIPEYPSLSGMAYLPQERMEEILQNTADAMNVPITSTKLTLIKDMVGGDYPQELMEGVWSIEAVCSGGISISVYGDGEICLRFRNKKLPSGYSFTYDDTTAEEADEVLTYLTEEYAAFLQMEDPVCWSYADRSYAGRENRSYYAYDRTGDPVQDILHYNLASVQFAPDDFGSLMLIRRNNAFCAAEYLGDYPIITAETAQQALLSGSYYTTVPEEYLKGGVIAEEDIARTELIYRNRSNEEFFQPYYRFYVELDTSHFVDVPEGLKDFGLFYVPAVSPEYLSDFEMELTFN